MGDTRARNARASANATASALIVLIHAAAMAAAAASSRHWVDALFGAALGIGLAAWARSAVRQPRSGSGAATETRETCALSMIAQFAISGFIAASDGPTLDLWILVTPIGTALGALVVRSWMASDAEILEEERIASRWRQFESDRARELAEGERRRADARRAKIARDEEYARIMRERFEI